MVKKIKRWQIQALATIGTNPFLNNFISGKIYKGESKGLCFPGLNCYSCPGAAGSCPIGSLQAVTGSSKYRFSYYVVGILLLFALVLGRVICGFLCPFGWFQELLHKIPTHKFSSIKLHKLTYLKYVILILFVFILPITIVNEVGMGDPFFCKFLCPAGILEGAIPLSLTDTNIRAALGLLFRWKTCLLIAILLLSIFFYRPFCKWFCPLGAIYGLFSKFSLVQYHIDTKSCTGCNACVRTCKMDVDVRRNPNSAECIRCGECIKSCPTQSIIKTFTLKKEPKNEI